MKTLNVNFEEQLNIRCHAAFRRAVERAAATEMSSASDYGRRAILRQLARDGADIAAIVASEQRGSAR